MKVVKVVLGAGLGLSAHLVSGCAAETENGSAPDEYASAEDDSALVDEDGAAIIGASCRQDSQCAPAEFCRTSGGTKSCAADRRAGQTCGRNAQCLSNLCSNGVCSAGVGGGSGGTGAGGMSSAGGSSSTGGAVSTGGTSGSGGSASEVARLSSEFDSLSGFSVAPKTSLLPGATARTVGAVGAVDGRALELRVPGNSNLGPSDYDGPGLHAIEVVANEAASTFGRYEFTVRFPACASDEEMVSGLFTYFNDGSDTDADGVADNSEIDIEHLCGEPENLWLTVWTDYQSGPTESFRRTSRLINMRTGSVQQTPLGSGVWGGTVPAGTLSRTVPGFPEPGTFYTFGFEWRQGFVSYYMLLGRERIELWRLEGASYVPQRSAKLLMNLWHPSTHWAKGGAADFPSVDALLTIDSVRVYQ